MSWVILRMVASTLMAKAEMSAAEMASACKEIAEKSEVFGKTITFPNNYKTGLCWGAFGALSWAYDNVGDNNEHHFGVCRVEGVTRAQQIMVFLDYAKNNPQLLDERFESVAWGSMIRAFPCKNDHRVKESASPRRTSLKMTAPSTAKMLRMTHWETFESLRARITLLSSPRDYAKVDVFRASIAAQLRGFHAHGIS